MTRLWRPETRPLAIAAIAAATLSWSALADEKPGPEDLVRIAAALKAAGCRSFEEIELDDGVWDVDDAVGNDGQKYDLKLDPQTFEIISRERD